MKKKELAESKNKTHEALKKAVADLEKEIATESVNLRLAKSKNVHLSRTMRKDLAQLKTLKVLKTISEKAEQSATS